MGLAKKSLLPPNVLLLDYLYTMNLAQMQTETKTAKYHVDMLYKNMSATEKATEVREMLLRDIRDDTTLQADSYITAVLTENASLAEQIYLLQLAAKGIGNDRDLTVCGLMYGLMDLQHLRELDDLCSMEWIERILGPDVVWVDEEFSGYTPKQQAAALDSNFEIWIWDITEQGTLLIGLAGLLPNKLQAIAAEAEARRDMYINAVPSTLLTHRNNEIYKLAISTYTDVVDACRAFHGSSEVFTWG